jgi:methylamine dehydrogenase accessory protein MauD
VDRRRRFGSVRMGEAKVVRCPPNHRGVGVGLDVSLLLVRLALAAIFAVAAFGKLADLGASRETVERFGVPAGLARPVGLLLPLIELAIAVSLLFAGAVRWAGLAAVVLLVVFCVVIVRVLVRGEAPECNCFGSLGSAPVGRGTLVRNGMLLSLAAFVTAAGWNDGGASAFAWIGDHGALAGIVGVIAAVTVIHIAFSWQLFRQNGRLLDRLADLEAAASSGSEGLEIGQRAPDFVLPDLEGRTVALADVLTLGRGALLFFTNPGCAQCNPVLRAAGQIQATENGTPVVVISTGDPRENQAKAQEYGLAQVLLQEAFEVAEAYRAFGVPSAVAIDAAGRIAAARAEGSEAVAEQLLRAAAVPRLPLMQVASQHALSHVGGAEA